MITNKDISIDSENGKITLNGNKYDLGTQGEIDTAVKDVYTVMGQMGAKNLIPYPYYRPNHYETNGITYDVSSDGVITMQTGTSTAENSYHMWVRGNADTSLHLDKGTYILSGCDINAPNSVSIIINGKDKNGNNKNVISQTSQYPNGIKFTIDDTYDLDMFGVFVYCGSGVTISSALTFKPMIRLASDTDNTYEPYAMTNKQLTEQVATKQDALTVTDISSQVTVVDTYVSEFKAYTYGKLIYLILALKPGVSDQTAVVTGLPNMRGLSGVKGVMPMFYMNAADAGSNGVCAISSGNIEYRGTTTSGTIGTVYSGMFILE